MANVTNLGSDTGKPFLKYPSDVSADAANYYVMFQINVQEKSKIDFGGTAYSTAPAGRSSEFSTIGVPRPPTKKLGTSICLYMPASLEVSHKANYGEAEIGLVAAANLSDLSNLKNFNVNNVLDNFKNEAKNALLTLQDVAFVGSKAAQQIQDGQITNNRTEMKFEGIDRRSFSFTFKMLPKTAAEAADVEEIVTMFRYHSMPNFEKGGTGVEGRTMIVPSTFDISYKPGIHLHRIGECALESVNVKFGGERPQFFKDHQPVETELTLQFKELDLITKEKVREGY